MPTLINRKNKRQIKQLLFIILLVFIDLAASLGQSSYSINIAGLPEKEIVSGHLDLGGTNPNGDSIAVNSYYISYKGQPFIPVIGEIHYSRYPARYWDESIRKMKAGGINVIATYVFWNVHERKEGVFDWSGNLNLRRFAELCEKNDVFLIVRMGPFCHGEMRNGGIPDWLYGRTFEIRSNDEEYLSYVDRLYGEIGKQCDGLLFKDGGPIVGVQLENEFQHSAAPWEITYPGARKEYTVANNNAAVTHEQISDTDGLNPYAEIGPGIQVKYSRRPVVDPTSVLPLMVRIIGSGSNGIGYYMYHGGSTPVFDGKFYNENMNGIPKINYDFQAPIGQYGQIRPHHSSLKTLHMFLQEYSEELAPMKTILPEGNEDVKPQNTKTLRYAVRTQDDKGFLFMINFQDHVEIADITDVHVEVKTGNEIIRFPSSGSFDLKKSASAIFPFNLKLGQTHIRSATVQPLTTLHTDQGACYVFHSMDGISSEMLINGEPDLTELQNARESKINNITLVQGENDEVFSFRNGKDQFLIIPYKMALNSSKMNDHLIISDGLILNNGKQMSLITRLANSYMYIYPAIDRDPPVTVKKVADRKYSVVTKGGFEQLNDVFIEIDYVGDRGMAFIDGLLVADHLYHEKKWEIGLKSFIPELSGKEMVLIFHPLYSDQETLVDFTHIPEFKNDEYLDIKKIDVSNEYKAIISFHGL